MPVCTCFQTRRSGSPWGGGVTIFAYNASGKVTRWVTKSGVCGYTIWVEKEFVCSKKRNRKGIDFDTFAACFCVLSFCNLFTWFSDCSSSSGSAVITKQPFSLFMLFMSYCSPLYVNSLFLRKVISPSSSLIVMCMKKAASPLCSAIRSCCRAEITNVVREIRNGSAICRENIPSKKPLQIFLCRITI